MHPVELQEMKTREQEEKRMLRIAAGIEADAIKEEKFQPNLINPSNEILDQISDLVDQANDADHVLDGLMPSVTMVRDIIIDTSPSMVDSECPMDGNLLN